MLGLICVQTTRSASGGAVQPTVNSMASRDPFGETDQLEETCGSHAHERCNLGALPEQNEVQAPSGESKTVHIESFPPPERRSRKEYIASTIAIMRSAPWIRSQWKPGTKYGVATLCLPRMTSSIRSPCCCLRSANFSTLV